MLSATIGHFVASLHQSYRTAKKCSFIDVLSSIKFFLSAPSEPLDLYLFCIEVKKKEGKKTLEHLLSMKLDHSREGQKWKHVNMLKHKNQLLNLQVEEQRKKT